ncbi:FAD-dependent oxidoreductase [Nakamurella deserti]|uniref:FAD-dependent oxidoreductase n=1 Tax=Nakamurella deserti TaxID=2164074 RepID=UPI000DBE634F|nr:FAD-dependent oxidoreductase [Nakamurella deserti]
MTDVLVIGAGVTGLTTAVLLAEQGAQVVVRTAEPPAQTTSVVAGALLGPVHGEPDDPRVRGWLEHGDAVFRELAADPTSGVRVRRGRLFEPGEPEPSIRATPGYAVCTGEDAIPRPGTTYRAELPLADMRVYLPYLVERLGRAGGVVELGTVATLAEAAAMAPVVVNCAGVAAGRLTGDADLHPVRGQHVIVADPGLDEFCYEGHAAAWTSWFPYGDRVVLGGVSVPGVWDRTPDPGVTAAILERAAAREPRLRGAEVLGVEVGLRPRRSTMRVEAGTVGRTRVVHHYGHGGNGVQWSWGTARDAVALALTGEEHQR